MLVSLPDGKALNLPARNKHRNGKLIELNGGLPGTSITEKGVNPPTSKTCGKKIAPFVDHFPLCAFPIYGGFPHLF